jgi:hypothetical protein
MELDQATVLERVSVALGAGGIINKEEQFGVTSKIVAGDNFGQITVLDVHRKIVMDKLKLPGFEGRRIISISTCSFEWAGTQLTYIAAIARASALVHIAVFKHSDCKLKALYILNLLPDLANPLEPELNSD